MMAGYMKQHKGIDLTGGDDLGWIWLMNQPILAFRQFGLMFMQFHDT